MRKIDPVITRGTVHGNCPKCGQPYLGELDADEGNVTLKCVGCSHIGHYLYYWPDELPKVTLRHKSSRQHIDRKRHKVKRKKNPDGILRGQLAFDLTAVP